MANYRPDSALVLAGGLQTSKAGRLLGARVAPDAFELPRAALRAAGNDRCPCGSNRKCLHRRARSSSPRSWCQHRSRQTDAFLRGDPTHARPHDAVVTRGTHRAVSHPK